MTKFHEYIDKRNKSVFDIDFGCIICCRKRKGNLLMCPRHYLKYIRYAQYKRK